MKYNYPAIFHLAEEGGYWVEFPDLPGCITEGDTFEEAYEMAQQVLSEYLIAFENDDITFNPPTSINKIKLEKNCIVNLISTNTINYRKEVNNTSVKKTLTIPGWLNEIAVKKNVNFSKLLQRALKNELEIN